VTPEQTRALTAAWSRRSHADGFRHRIGHDADAAPGHREDRNDPPTPHRYIIGRDAALVIRCLDVPTARSTASSRPTCAHYPKGATA